MTKLEAEIQWHFFQTLCRLNVCRRCVDGVLSVGLHSVGRSPILLTCDRNWRAVYLMHWKRPPPFWRVEPSGGGQNPLVPLNSPMYFAFTRSPHSLSFSIFSLPVGRRRSGDITRTQNISEYTLELINAHRVWCDTSILCLHVCS